MIAEIKKKKIGLALGSGAARGLAHIGVLDVLEREGIPIDIIAGTSAGAVIGAIYASRQDAARIKREALAISWKRRAALVDPSLPRSGLIKGKRIESLFTRYIGGNLDFSELKLPFACVATDIDTGEEIIIKEGPVVKALRASISIPAVFTVAEREGRYLVDGGLTTPVPVKVVKDMGADFVIAVNVTPQVVERNIKMSEKRARKPKEPGIFYIITQSIYITTYALAQGNLEQADVVIEPEVGVISAGDFTKISDLIRLGEEATEKAIPEIKRKMGEE
jgi:NTE family protein